MPSGVNYTEAEYAALLAQGNVREVRAQKRAPRAHEPIHGVVQHASPAAPREEPETRFMARVLAVAKQHGWMAYHTHDSRKSTPGFPDLLLAKPGHPLLCIELKTNTGKPTMEQLQWLSVLQRTEKPQAAIWRPGDWDTILTILSHKTEEHQ